MKISIPGKIMLAGMLLLLIGLAILKNFFGNYDGDLITECLTYGCPTQIIVGLVIGATGAITTKVGYEAHKHQ